MDCCARRNGVQALDKIEEIRKLDEQFEDPEKIAERAQKELAREEQEAERQNELAAMYAEAVRLDAGGEISGSPGKMAGD